MNVAAWPNPNKTLNPALTNRTYTTRVQLGVVVCYRRAGVCRFFWRASGSRSVRQYRQPPEHTSTRRADPSTLVRQRADFA